MSGPSVRFKVNFGRQRESRLTAPPSQPGAPAVHTTGFAATPIARLLALAHHVERLVEAGELKDYADAAKRLGMCKSHVTHIMNLLQLAPDIQEAILIGSLRVAERQLRQVSHVHCWAMQRSVTA